MSVKLAKSNLRKEIQLLLKKVNKNTIIEETKNSISQILNDPIYKNSKKISIFVSTSTEINTDELIENSLNSGKTVFIPYFEKNSEKMEMLILPSIDIFNELSKNFYGIRQYNKEIIMKISSNIVSQSSDSCEIKDISYITHGPLDLIICPLVAVSKDGFRLGHGKGYYDKFFQEHKRLFSKIPISYGLALSCQIKERKEIPIEDYDYKLDKVFYSC